MTVAEPRVLNVREAGKNTNDDQVYVGRRSKWGNPWKVGESGTRDEVIALYREYLEDAVYEDPISHQRVPLLSLIGELRGKNLVCWCAPQACHADILLELANK